MNRVAADYMGMLATIMNALASGCPENEGVYSRVQLPWNSKLLNLYPQTCHSPPWKQSGYFAGGTGTYFTTDTTAVLRAIEIGADVILKATKVDGVYDKIPYNMLTQWCIERLVIGTFFIRIWGSWTQPPLLSAKTIIFLFLFLTWLFLEISVVYYRVKMSEHSSNRSTEGDRYEELTDKWTKQWKV